MNRRDLEALRRLLRSLRVEGIDAATCRRLLELYRQHCPRSNF